MRKRAEAIGRGSWIWNAIAHAETNPAFAFRCFHLALRSHAIATYVYLLRVKEMYDAWRRAGGTGKKPAIRRTDRWVLAEATSLGATAIAMREHEMGHFFFREVVRILTEPEPYVEPDAIEERALAPFLLKLWLTWQHTEPEGHLAQRLGAMDYGIFQSIFDGWNDESIMAEAMREVADTHAFSAVNASNMNVEVYGGMVGWLAEFPAEILFLNVVRRDLCLPIPDVRHPMLDSPLARTPLDDFTSGYDEFLELTLTNVRNAGMADLRIPWEERFQALGESDPKRVRLE